jgi:hypothetical protein
MLIKTDSASLCNEINDGNLNKLTPTTANPIRSPRIFPEVKDVMFASNKNYVIN